MREIVLFMYILFQSYPTFSSIDVPLSVAQFMWRSHLYFWYMHFFRSPQFIKPVLRGTPSTPQSPCWSIQITNKTNRWASSGSQEKWIMHETLWTSSCLISCYYESEVDNTYLGPISCLSSSSQVYPNQQIAWRVVKCCTIFVTGFSTQSEKVMIGKKIIKPKPAWLDKTHIRRILNFYSF